MPTMLRLTSNLPALALAAAVLAWGLLILPARADCNRDFQDTLRVARSIKNNAINNTASASDGSQQAFQDGINRLEAGNCTAQLLNLYQIMQREGIMPNR